MKQVLSTEKKRVLESKDYSLFTLNDNFITSKKHFNKILNSISEKNLCCDYPILVDQEYNVLDGKYRFMVCYELQLPVFYKIAEKTNLFDAIKIKNIHRKTPIEEVVHAYSEFPNYRNIVEMFREYEEKIPIKQIIHTILWDKKGGWVNDFYAGKFVKWDIDSFKKKADRVLEIMSFFGTKYYSEAIKMCIEHFSESQETNQFNKIEMLAIRKIVKLKSSKEYISQIGSCYNTLLNRATLDYTSAMEVLKNDKVIDIHTYSTLTLIGVKPKKPVYAESDIDWDDYYSAMDKYNSKPYLEWKDNSELYLYNKLKENGINKNPNFSFN